MSGRVDYHKLGRQVRQARLDARSRQDEYNEKYRSRIKLSSLPYDFQYEVGRSLRLEEMKERREEWRSALNRELHHGAS